MPKRDSSQLRLIFDTGRAKFHFNEPWHSPLPAGDPRSDLELPLAAVDGMSLAQADVEDSMQREQHATEPQLGLQVSMNRLQESVDGFRCQLLAT